jgi:hypothetical protein
LGSWRSSVLLATAGALLAAAPAAATLLVNGGAEVGSLAGWQLAPAAAPASATQSRSQATGVVTPYEGSWFFTFANASYSSTITLSQSGTTGLAADALVLNGHYQTEYGDLAQVVLSILDGSGGVLASDTTGPITTPNLTWLAFSELEVAIPVGAASWRVELRGSLVYGSYINAHFDALELHAVTLPVPEPGALGVLGASLALLRLRRRR